MPFVRSAAYLQDVFDPAKYPKLVRQVKQRVTELKVALKFDAIAFRGNSGAALAYPVCAALKLPMICVRKGESSHGQPVEAATNVAIRKYLIVDDLISTGDTIRAIVDAITKAGTPSIPGGYSAWQGPLPKCAGILLWGQSYGDASFYFEGDARPVPIVRI
jgi:hypothetical protein